MYFRSYDVILCWLKLRRNSLSVRVSVGLSLSLISHWCWFVSVSMLSVSVLSMLVYLSLVGVGVVVGLCQCCCQCRSLSLGLLDDCARDSPEWIGTRNAFLVAGAENRIAKRVSQLLCLFPMSFCDGSSEPNTPRNVTRKIFPVGQFFVVAMILDLIHSHSQHKARQVIVA